MRVLVCGSRSWLDRRSLNEALDHIAAVLRVTEVIHGDAIGADKFAGAWAKAHHLPVTAFPAEWTRLGRRAGAVRNRVMLDIGKPALVIAFPLPDSIGTWDMVRQARKAGIPTFVMPDDLVKVDALGEGVFV